MDYHILYHPLTIEKFKFWFPFTSKFFSYLMILIVKFNYFLGLKTSTLSSYSASSDFKSNYFICKEDQSALGLLLLVIKYL